MSDVLYSFPALRPIRDAKDLELLRSKAEADAHHVIGPSFIFEKHGEIAGYVGINSLPHWHGWFDTQRILPRDSCMLVNQIENHVRLQGAKYLTWMLPTESPFCPIMGRMGYKHASTLKLGVKLF